MTKFLILFILLNPCVVFSQTQPAVNLDQKLQFLAGEIKNETGVDVIYKDWPGLQRADLRFSFATESDYPTLVAFMELLRQELLKYPASFWEKFFIPKIVLVKKHFFHEKPAEGLFTTKADVIFLDFSRSRRNAQAQSHNIHHEIFHQIDFHILGPQMTDDQEWRSLNAPGFVYTPTPETRSTPVEKTLDPRIPPVSGFATDYATTLVAEDKAEIFACLMVPSQNKLIHRWATKDKILQKKIEAMKKMINEFCPEMVL